MGDYDIIYSSNVLHWCKDKDLVFKQISKTLKIGGKLSIVVTGTKYNICDNIFSPTDLTLDPAHRQHIIDQIYPFTPRMITNLATCNGFEIEYLGEHWHEWKFEDIQKLIEFYLVNWNIQPVIWNTWREVEKASQELTTISYSPTACCTRRWNILICTTRLMLDYWPVYFEEVTGVLQNYRWWAYQYSI